MTNITNFVSIPYNAGALSGARESWEYDSGARDLQSPDPQNHTIMQKFLEFGGKATTQAALQRLLSQSSCLGSNVGGSYLELANTVSEALSNASVLLSLPR